MHPEGAGETAVQGNGNEHISPATKIFLWDTYFKASSGSPAGRELKAKSGAWQSGEEYRPVISILHTQLNAYAEGYDFDMTVTGEIEFKHHPSC